MADGIMIAYLPVDGSWCKQDFPHMTLVYAGTTDEMDRSQFNSLAKDAISASRMTGSFSLPVTGVEEFGEDDEAVDVLVLYPTPQLILARKFVENWNKSQYKEFQPHATIGPVGSASAIVENPAPYSESYRRQALPTKLYFNRIAACYGNDRLIFNIDEIY